MESKIESLLHNCLYFTANSLSRRVSRLAEEEFRLTGLSPAHAFLLMVVNEQPGLTQKELSLALHLAPSTVTRFLDALSLRQGLLQRRTEGRVTRIYPSPKGREMQETIARCWKGLYRRYSEILGETEGRDLTRAVDLASRKLEE